MVSRTQLVLIVRRVLCVFAFALPGMAALSASGDDAVRKFYSDDPLWKEPVPRSVHQVAVRKVDDI
ncbi:MAG: hypothetical protein DMG11_34925, partial [Acidobacteria bacterium]